MIYKICKEIDSDKLKAYLFENKEEIIPSAIEQMYGNETAIGMRLERKMEIAVLAINEADGEIKGVVSAISPNMDNNWTVVALHVLEKERRKKIATELLRKMKEELVSEQCAVKCAASIMNMNKSASACYIMNGFEYEGKLSALEKDKEIAVFGTVLRR